MARSELPPPLLRDICDLAARWGKIAARRAVEGAAEGAALDFNAMEQVAAAAAAAALVEGTLSSLHEHHAQTLPAEVPCPGCARPCPVARQQRLLTVRSGQRVPLDEPIAHCPACRRDFFPPPARPGA